MALLRTVSNNIFYMVVSYLFLHLVMLSPDANCAVLPLVNLDGNQPNSTLLDPSNPLNFQCSYERTWTNTRFFEIGQCYVAIRYMLHEEGIDPFEPELDRRRFVSPSAPPQEGPPEPILTPRKYVAHECTLAILMRSDVHPGDLPKETGRSTIKSDTSSYKEIASAAFAVYDYCAIRKPRVPGWAQVGNQHGMAVALWGTDSFIDRRYPNLRTVHVPTETS